MPNLIIGLRYIPPYREVETEEQVARIFSELKEYYNQFKPQFKMASLKGKNIENLNQFLSTSIRDVYSDTAKGYIGNGPYVVLTGSGDIGGLVIKDASVCYDMSAVSYLTRCWDANRETSCHICKNNRRGYIAYCEKDFDQKKNGRSDDKICPGYDFREGSEKRPVKSLKILIDEAC